MEQITPGSIMIKMKEFFLSNGTKFEYVNQRENTVVCQMIEDGIEVNCLGNIGYKNFLPWGVFYCVSELLLEQDGRAKRGSGMNGRLGQEIPLDSVEGRVAHRQYGKQVGDTIFMRISPIAKIFIATGICEDQRGDLVLRNFKNSDKKQID